MGHEVCRPLGLPGCLKGSNDVQHEGRRMRGGSFALRSTITNSRYNLRCHYPDQTEG
jgi:hypothetical protein